MSAPLLPPVSFGRALVGVSGGRDSAALLHHLVAQGVAVHVAHVNYGLRGADSDADEAFVRALGLRYGVPVHVRRAPPPPAAGRQAWARAVRYAFFGETATALGLGAVAVAHHADDQAETVLLGLLRGRRLAALRGMRRRRWLDPDRFPGVVLVRPLLGTPAAHVHAYAEAHGLAWRDDASNHDRRYRRSVVRHDLLPLLDALAPGVRARLVGLGREAAALHRAQRRQTDEHAAAALRPDGTAALEPLRALPPAAQEAVLDEAVRRFLPAAAPGRTRAAALRRLLAAQPGRRVAWPEGTVWRERDALRFVPAGTAGADGGLEAVGAPVAVAPGQTVRAGAWTVAAGRPGPRPDAVGDDPWVAYVPVAAFPLAVRPWQAGDRLAVLGGDAPRRVAGLLARAKVPPSEKAAWPLVAAASGAPLWLPGVRLGAAGAARAGEASVRVAFSRAPTGGSSVP